MVCERDSLLYSFDGWPYLTLGVDFQQIVFCKILVPLMVHELVLEVDTICGRVCRAAAQNVCKSDHH